MRRSLLFFALCSALDEAFTFINIQLGGVELNPQVARLIVISPLLYTLCDAALLLLFHVVDCKLTINDLWLVWAASGVARLVCLAWGMG